MIYYNKKKVIKAATGYATDYNKQNQFSNTGFNTTSYGNSNASDAGMYSKAAGDSQMFSKGYDFQGDFQNMQNMQAIDNEKIRRKKAKRAQSDGRISSLQQQSNNLLLKNSQNAADLARTSNLQNIAKDTGKGLSTAQKTAINSLEKEAASTAGKSNLASAGNAGLVSGGINTGTQLALGAAKNAVDDEDDTTYTPWEGAMDIANPIITGGMTAASPWLASAGLSALSGVGAAAGTSAAATGAITAATTTAGAMASGIGAGAAAGVGTSMGASVAGAAGMGAAAGSGFPIVGTAIGLAVGAGIGLYMYKKGKSSAKDNLAASHRRTERKIRGNNLSELAKKEKALADSNPMYSSLRGPTSGSSNYYHNFVTRSKRLGGVLENSELLTIKAIAAKKKVKNDSKVPMFREGGYLTGNENIVPNGVKHEEYNKLGDKGMPVVKCDKELTSCTKKYEIELDELITNFDTTKEIEKLAKGNKIKELGIFMTKQLLENTHSFSEKYKEINKKN